MSMYRQKLRNNRYGTKEIILAQKGIRMSFCFARLNKCISMPLKGNGYV